MERALKVLVFYLPQTELNAAVRTAVPEKSELAVAIPPCNKFFSETGQSQDLVFPDLRGFHDDIPLIAYHIALCFNPGP